MDVAWQLIKSEGTEALTLGRLAEQAGVTKPVVYSQFITRSGLLAELYKDFDIRQTRLMDAALEASEKTLESKAHVIATSYVDCVLFQGREIPSVIAALASTPELEKIRREYESVFMDKCRRIFEPFTNSGELRLASLKAMIGAAEALSNAAANKEITADEAKDELQELIIILVKGSASTHA
ncbi:transcriptional regulator [Pseudomonas asuensis]|uniref:Transcriptional regulator n=1 Tax=Pseudomonas asuensis TaxID=1825787 RepID=A0ABQ2H348_9PSED|nr:transcriptional regulator [Pseudomonas asuensis]